MIAAAGPLTASPPTIGLTATRAAREPSMASRTPRTASSGSIETNGLLGATITASASAIASITPGAGRASAAPGKRSPVTVAEARPRTK